MTSAVMIVPAALRDDANALGEELGWGPGNFSVPLSADGSEPATHYGACAASVGAEFLDLALWPDEETALMLGEMVGTEVPAPAEDADPDAVAATYGPWIRAGGSVSAHWRQMLELAGLVVVGSQDPGDA